tara:strand:- start:256 stop:1143 length:888 start_codon:yes stop_codon:yes gene_type:complete
MSRNRKRIQIPQQSSPKPQPPAPSPPPQVKKDANPFGLSFVVPTEIVHLPSGGNLYAEGTPLAGLTQVEVKSVTAAEEDIMINDSFINQGIVFDKLINAIMITPNVKADDLLECDKMAILMSARKTGYGDDVTFNTSCENCGAEHEMSVKLSNILKKNEENPYTLSTSEEWKYLESSNTISFVLPSTGLDVQIRLMTPSDYDSLESSRQQKSKLNLPFNETIEFIRMVLVEAAGVADRLNLNKLAEILPAADARKIRIVHNSNIPTIDTKQEVTCPECSHTSEKEVPFSLGWFWS